MYALKKTYKATPSNKNFSGNVHVYIGEYDVYDNGINCLVFDRELATIADLNRLAGYGCKGFYKFKHWKAFQTAQRSAEIERKYGNWEMTAEWVNIDELTESDLLPSETI